MLHNTADCHTVSCHSFLCNLDTTTEIDVYVLFRDVGISFVRDSVGGGDVLHISKCHIKMYLNL